MNLSYKIYSTKKQSKLLLRMYRKDFDLSVALELSVTPEQWSQENQCFKNNQVLNTKLLELKLAVLNQYNMDYCNGTIINKQWLSEAISSAFNRPKDERNLVNENHKVFFTDFCGHWLENEAKSWKTSYNKTMSEALVSQYRNTLNILLKFEKSRNEKVVIKDINSDLLYELAVFMESEKYSIGKIDREIGRAKFYCNRIKESGLRISDDYKKKLHLNKSNNETESVFLDEKELESIFSLDLSYDDVLDSVRDNLILSAYTGLRCSDFMSNLNIDNIKDGLISIKTKKTGAFVSIPIHSFVKQILSKRFGQLPSRLTLTEYNKKIKTVCMLAKIDSQTYGAIWNPETKRKEFAYRPKYAFCSSHIGRKSMTTNLSGKVSNNILKSVMGWTSDKMIDKYNKTSKENYANQLSEYWNGENN